MILQNPITINIPPITKPDGSVKNISPIVLTELDFVLIDDPKRKVAQVKIRPCLYPLILWIGNEYDNAGDYTQSQIENKITEYLGNDPKTQLEKLFLPEDER